MNFTKFSSVNKSETVVKMLSSLFINFDLECKRLKLFKLYTIGDSYCVVSL